MKVALVHDSIGEFGGAERVLLALSEVWPDAPIYTAFARGGETLKRLTGKRIIFFGGRLSWLKGGREICLAIKNVIETMPNAVLLLASKTDGEVKEILDFAAGLGIDKNIIAAGWLSGNELKAAYNAADIVAVPSICFDSFPTINLEAMACRKPVIATCFGGSREAVLDGETGYIVNPFNIETMAEKIIDLLKNTDKARMFGETGYQKAREKFGLDMMIEDYLSWYK